MPDAPQTTQPIQQYAEEPAVYVLQVALSANQPLNAQKVPIDNDSDFMLTGLNGSSTGAYTLNILLPSGRKLSNNQLKAANLVSSSPSQPTAIGPPPIYRAAGIGPSVDLTDTSAAGNSIELVFTGIRRFKVAG